MASSCIGEIQVGQQETLLLQESDQVLKGAAQRGGRVTIPRGIQETFRCCAEGHGLAGNIGDMWTAGLEDLRGLFQSW